MKIKTIGLAALFASVTAAFAAYAADSAFNPRYIDNPPEAKARGSRLQDAQIAAREFEQAAASSKGKDAVAYQRAASDERAYIAMLWKPTPAAISAVMEAAEIGKRGGVPAIHGPTDPLWPSPALTRDIELAKAMLSLQPKQK